MSKKNERSSVNEVHLVIMRLLSVFMSRTKSGSKSSSEVYLFSFFTSFAEVCNLDVYCNTLIPASINIVHRAVQVKTHYLSL